MPLPAIEIIAANATQFPERIKMGSGVSEAVIIAAENVLGVQFPEDYRNFLLRYGGGYLGGNEIFGLPPEIEYLEEPDLHVVFVTKEYRRLWEVSSFCVVLMDFDGDEFYVLDCASDEASVWLHIHSEEPELYAQNFSDFIAKQIGFRREIWMNDAMLN